MYLTELTRTREIHASFLVNTKDLAKNRQQR